MTGASAPPRHTRVRKAVWHVWRMPLALAALTVFGLLAALLGTGVWHLLAWLAMATPVAAVLWHGLRWCV